MAQFQGNFRPVSDVYDLKSDKREFRANANIMHDLLGHEAALTKEVASHLLVAGFTRAPHPRQQIKSADDPTGKGATSSRGWFVPPKLSLAGVNTGGETPEAHAALGTDRVGDTDQYRMPLQAPLSALEPEELLQGGSADVAALSGAQEAESKTACNTYSDVAAILAAANEPIVANANLSDPSIMFTRAASSFDLSKRPSGLRVVAGSAEAFAPMDVNEKLVYALAWASLGVKGFALSDSKTPLKGSHGFLDATTDASVLKGMFAPKERCFAISNYETDAPDFDLLMFDNDQKPAEVDKPAKDGLAVFGKIEAEVGRKFPATYTERTPSGGGRRLYKVPKGTTVGLKRNQINFLSERYGIHGLDIPNYCVMAPSVTAKGRYTVVDDQPVQWLEGKLLDFIVAHIGKRGEHVIREGDTHVEDGDYSSLAAYTGQLADEVKEAIEAIDFSQINRHQWLAVGARAILCGCTGVFMQKTTDKANSSYSSGDENILQECVKLTADIQAQPEAERFGVVFGLAGKNPSYVNPKSRQAQHHSDVPEGMRYVDGSDEAFGSSIKLGITTESLLHGIDQAGDDAWQRKLNGSTQYRHSAAWFASGVLDGDREKMFAYQTMYPTTSKGAPRKLVSGDRIDWSAAVYTAAMHIAGDVVIQNDNKQISNFNELTQESKDRLTNQVVELFEASEIVKVWDETKTAGSMRDTITNAVRDFKIKSNSAKTSSNNVETLPAVAVAPAQPPVHSGFDLSRPPASLTGRAEPATVAPPAAMGVPVQTAVEAPSAELVGEITAALKYKLHESESHLRKCVDGLGAEPDWYGGKLYGLLTGNIAWMKDFCIRYPVRGDGNAIGWFTPIGEVDYENAVYAACHELAKIALPQHIEDGEARKVRYDSARKAIIELVKAAGVQGVMMWSLAKCHGDTGKMNEWLVNKKISKCLSNRITRLAALDAEAKRLQTESLSRDVALKARIAAGEYHVNLMQKLRDLYAKPWNETAHMAGETDFSVPLTDEAEFLHYSKGKYVRPLCTPENVALLLGYYGCRARHNEMRHAPEYEGFGSDDGDHEGALDILYNIAQRNGLRWMKSDVDSAFKTWAASQKFHPAKEWIESKPWDGVSRIEALADTITVDVGQRPMWLIYFRRWLLGAINALYSKVGGASKHILLWQGAQSEGKTRWFRTLSGGNAIGKEGVNLNVDNPDSVRQTVTWWLVELGEIDATFAAKDIASLKAFLTKPTDEWRDPYARRANTHPRRTAFVGSVNKDEPLADFTGNTRFATVTAVHVDSEHNVDVQQLWAEVLSIWLNGTSEEKRHWLTREEEKLMEIQNERYTAKGVGYDYVAFAFDWSDKGRAEMRRAYEGRDSSHFMAGAEVYQLLESVGYRVGNQAQKMEVANALTKLGAIQHKGTGGVRGYYLPKINPKATPAR